MPDPKAGGMNKDTAIQVEVHVVFEEETEFGSYKDALVYPEAEYANLPANEVAVKVRERIDAFRFKRRHPPRG